MSNDAVYFWRPEETNGYLGQWYPSKFTSTDDNGQKTNYENTEQYMMHGKALLFAPTDPIVHSIVPKDSSTPVPHPRDLRSLGRKIPNFSDETWAQNRFSIVVEGNYLKFTQNEDLKRRLLGTGEKEIVEASPRDRIWGIGFGEKRAPEVRDKWGLNLLGKALMEVRERIRKEEEEKA